MNPGLAVEPAPDRDATAPPARRGALRRMLRRPTAVLCVAWLALVVLGALLADVVAPYGPVEQNLADTYAGPSSTYLLGTDQLGRDVLSRLLHGGRVSLPAVGVAVSVFVVLGILGGLVAGYRGGRTDRLVMRLCDLLMSIPGVVILLVVLAVFSRNETAAMTTFGVLASANLMRIVRASTMEVSAEQYVVAATTAGLTTPEILRRHVLPRIAGPVIVQSALLAATALLVESGLNYLGLGVQPPQPSWGGLVADASAAISVHPWLLVPSGGVIVLTALAFGLLGDVVRDASADRRPGAGVLSWRRMRTVVTPPPAAVATEVPDDSSSLLTARGLTVTLPSPDGPVVVVDGVDLDIARGEVLGVVGESGCGKSMTVSALLRLLPPDGRMTASRYRLGDDDLLACSESTMRKVRGRRIASISQEPVAALDPAFTVGQQLEEVVRHHTGRARGPARERVLELLEMVHLPDPAAVAKKYPHELSGGMAQRVSIARALAGDPELLVADEPTTALDVTVQAEILDLLRELGATRGMAVVLVTHDWGVVADLCDRAVVMYAGQVVEQGTVAELVARPRHPYTAALLAANPSAGAPGEPLAAIPGTVPAPRDWPETCRFLARCTRSTAACATGPVALRIEDGAGHRCLRPLSPQGPTRSTTTWTVPLSSTSTGSPSPTDAAVAAPPPR